MPEAAPVDTLVPSAPASATPVAQVAEAVLPRNPDDVIHNVIVRQLSDEIQNPVTEEPESAALQALAAVVTARQEGKSLEPYRQQLGVQLSGGDELNRLAWHLYRRYRVNKLVKWLQADEIMDRMLMRCFRRGDFTPTEALVFKKLSQTTVNELATELLDEIKESAGPADAGELITKLDVSTKAVEEDPGRALLSKTTPQGREIVRKLVFTARQKLFQKKSA